MLSASSSPKIEVGTWISKFTRAHGYLEMHIQNNFSAIRARLRRLPPIHQTTFQAIIEHLGRVQHRKARNKMDAKNIAVVFSEPFRMLCVLN